MRSGGERPRLASTAALWIALSLFPQAGSAGTVVLEPSKDCSLYSEDGTLGNGSGQYLFSGRTVFTGSRRALLAFDVASAVPAGSTIVGVSLTLHVSLSPLGPVVEHPFSLHRLLADWGEGGSDPEGAEGNGVAAEPGDATWTHRVFPGTSWTSPGGNYVGSASAGTLAPHTSDGFATWSSTASLVADVQGWLDSPAANFGWVVIGDESTTTTARRFDSLQNETLAFRPALTIQYTPPAAGVGAVPDGADVPGAPLALAKAGGGSIQFTWGGSCQAGATDYSIYEGTVGGNFTSHEPLLCSTGGLTTATAAPAIPTSSYYLVVPRDASVEGSYGRNHAGVERPQGPETCRPQMLSSCP